MSITPTAKLKDTILLEEPGVATPLRNNLENGKQCANCQENAMDSLCQENENQGDCLLLLGRTYVVSIMVWEVRIMLTVLKISWVKWV